MRENRACTNMLEGQDAKKSHVKLRQNIAHLRESGSESEMCDSTICEIGFFHFEAMNDTHII